MILILMTDGTQLSERPRGSSGLLAVFVPSNGEAEADAAEQKSAFARLLRQLPASFLQLTAASQVCSRKN